MNFQSRIALAFFIFLACYIHAQDFYSVKDLTAENLFTANCEGPAVDKKGNLFVVNYRKDGTIGQVAANGSVKLFVELPEGSIGNAIQFDQKGNMLVADFARHTILKIDVKSRKISVLAHNDSFNQPNVSCNSKTTPNI